jgi:hypothetical protein
MHHIGEGLLFLKQFRRKHGRHQVVHPRCMHVLEILRCSKFFMIWFPAAAESHAASTAHTAMTPLQ